MHRWRRRDVYAEVIADRRAQAEADRANQAAVDAASDENKEERQATTVGGEDGERTSKIARVRQVANHVLENMGIEHVYGPQRRSE